MTFETAKLEPKTSNNIRINPSVVIFPKETTMHYEDGDTAVYSLIGKANMSFKKGTYYLYVIAGYAVYNESVYVPPGFYGSFIDGKIETTAAAEVMVVQARRYAGMFQFGGPIEYSGRLRYINGCSDTGLLGPVKMGDPCLNFLHFPERTTQDAHVHPDLRVGCVARGSGECVTPFGNFPLMQGDQFVIFPATGVCHQGNDGFQHLAGEHSFNTAEDTMDVISYHPTSAVGPTDERHQMLRQTHLV